MRKIPPARFLFFAAGLLFPAVAFASGEDPSVPLLLYLVVILVTAKLMGHLAVLLGQPAVLGELLAVGVGMIPRGEVGLIFASIGASLVFEGEKVIGATTYSAVVIMVIVTTLVTPPLLKWTLMNRKTAPPSEDGA